MNVSEIATRVKRQFGDEAGIQFDDSDVIRWVNDGMQEIALQNQLFQTLASTDIVAGTNSYEMPPDILTLTLVEYIDSSGNQAKLKYLNYNEALEITNSTETGTPTIFYTWANAIYLFPRPDTARTGGLRLFYTRQITPVAATTDTPEIPLQYHNRLVEYCLQQAYELDENWQAANVKSQQFSQGVQQLKDNVDWVSRDYYPMITSTDLEWVDGSYY